MLGKPGTFIRLETELSIFSELDYSSPVVIFSKLKEILGRYGLTVDDEDLYIDHNDTEADFYFELNYDTEYRGDPVYLTVSYQATPTNTFKVEAHIMTEEELVDFIGDDEIEEI